MLRDNRAFYVIIKVNLSSLNNYSPIYVIDYHFFKAIKINRKKYQKIISRYNSLTGFNNFWNNCSKEL